MLQRIFLITMLLCFGIVAYAQDEPTPTPEPFCDTLVSSDVDLAYYMGQGDVFFRDGSYTRAIDSYTCAIERDPEYVPAYIRRGFAYATQRNDLLAFEDFNRALELAPDSVEAYTNRGILYTMQGGFVPALADFDLALALDPEYVVAYYNRGIVHAIEGNFDLAIDDFEFVLELDPDFEDAYAALGSVHLAIAMQSYRGYWELAGRTTNPPGGDPEFMLFSLRQAFEQETFTPWLLLQIPAR